MTAFAAEGWVGHDPIGGSVEISDEEYVAAIAGMIGGKVITIVGGFAIIDPPLPPEPEVPEDTINQKLAAVPSTLFGGPSIREIFNGHE